MNYEQAVGIIPYVFVGAGIVCFVAGYWLGEIMGHANSGYHDERPFASVTWRNYTHHFWPNTVYYIRKLRGEKNPEYRRIG